MQTMQSPQQVFTVTNRGELNKHHINAMQIASWGLGRPEAKIIGID